MDNSTHKHTQLRDFFLPLSSSDRKPQFPLLLLLWASHSLLLFLSIPLSSAFVFLLHSLLCFLFQFVFLIHFSSHSSLTFSCNPHLAVMVHSLPGYFLYSHPFYLIIQISKSFTHWVFSYCQSKPLPPSPCPKKHTGSYTGLCNSSMHGATGEGLLRKKTSCWSTGVTTAKTQRLSDTCVHMLQPRETLAQDLLVQRE